MLAIMFPNAGRFRIAPTQPILIQPYADTTNTNKNTPILLTECGWESCAKERVQVCLFGFIRNCKKPLQFEKNISHLRKWRVSYHTTMLSNFSLLQYKRK